MKLFVSAFLGDEKYPFLHLFEVKYIKLMLEFLIVLIVYVILPMSISLKLPR